MRGQVSALSLVVTLLSTGALAQEAAPAAAAAAPESKPAETTPADDVKPVETRPAETAPAEKPAEVKSDVKPEGQAVVVPPSCGEKAAVCVKNDNFALWPRLRIRTGYEYIQPESQILYIGQNDGFFADQLRFGVDGAFRDSVRFRFILDATSILPGGGQNQPVSNLVAAARDVWVSYKASPWLVLSAGQQFMPTDLEGTTTIVNLPFARRSVATSGVLAGKGVAVTGLSPSRQLGVVIGTNGPQGDDGPALGPVNLEYKLAVSNGNGQNLLGNDNKLPAVYGRLGAGYEKLISVGFGGRYNPRTVGSLPNLYAEADMLGFADVSVHAAGFEIVAQGLYRATSLSTFSPDPNSAAGQDNGMGGTAWIWAQKPFGFDLFGVQPAYRISYYDPSSAFATDQLLENSVGIRWDIPVDVLRLSAFADYTFLTELGDTVRDLQDDRFTAMLQLEL